MNARLDHRRPRRAPRPPLRRCSPRSVIRRRSVVVLLAVLVPLALLLAAGAGATANTTIGFDDLPAGSVVTNHYAADGITFGRASDYGLNLGNADCGPPQAVSDPADAHSAPNVASAPRCSSSDSSSVGTFAAFSFARKDVSAYVGTTAGNQNQKAIMIGYDSSGTFVAFTPQTVIGTGANTLLSISRPSADIAYVAIYLEGVVGAGTPLLIDDLSLDNSTAPLSVTGTPFSALAGSSFSGVVGHIADSDPTAIASDYSVSLNWGDGQTSAGAVSAAAGGGFDIRGTHTFAAARAYTVTSSVTKVNGRTASGNAVATVTSGTSTTTSTTTTPTTSTTTTPTTSTTTTPTTSTTTSTATTPTPAPPHVSFTAPASVGTGQTVALDASSSQPGGTYQWSVNGRELANCAGVTSRLMTRTLPVGTDTIALRQVVVSGASVLTTKPIVVKPLGSSALVAAGKHVRVLQLPAVAVCQSAPGDPRSARVAPNVAYAPGVGCTTQVKSGVVDAVGCLTEYQDPIQVAFKANQRGHLGTQKVSLPAGQVGFDGVSSPADTSALLTDVENALNPPHPKFCVDSQGNDFICSTVGQEQQPAAPTFGGVPVQGGGPVTGLAVRAKTNRVGTAASAPAQEIALAGNACTVAPSKQTTGETECLDLWVSTGPVRINGVDFAPAPGEEIVIAPQFNLLVSQNASTSLDGLLLNSDHPFKGIDFSLPPGATGSAPSGIDYPALTVGDLQHEITKQRNLPSAATIINELGSVGGFPSVQGLEISFEDDTAIITLHVQLPDPFNGGDGPVTAAVQARVGPTEPFHVVYGYLGNNTGGSKVDLGPVALSGFGICFRAHYSLDTSVDPCRDITGIVDDSGFGDNAWIAVGNLNIGDFLNVAFRPGTNSIAGCSQSIPLGFVFSGDGLSQAGAALDLKGSGGIPIFPGVSITGLAAGFSSTTTYNLYGGCVGLSVLDLLSITGNVVGVDTVNGARYDFSHNELGAGVLQQTGGAFPYTNHVGIGASGVASLTLPELPAFQVGDAYALYVDDPAAVFFGAGIDTGFPHGNYEDQPGLGIALKGGIKGAIGLGRGFPFDFEGYLNIAADAGPFSISGEAEAIISYSPQNGHHGGIGLCVGLGAGNGSSNASGSAGIAYHWGDTWFTVLGHLNFGSCTNNWLDQEIGVNVQAARVARGGPRASVATASVPRGLNAVNFHVQSATGAPDVTVTAPGGASASTAGMPLNQIVRGSAFTLLRVPTLHTTTIVPVHPRAGRYRITTNPGSPAITRIDRADGFRPRISAHVSGQGKHRRLHYSFTRQTGQSVEFFEISGQVHRALGSTTGGHGTITFTASAGHGRRQIVAEVYGDGVPRVRIPLTSYLAPSLVRLGRVGHLRMTRRRALATVSFTGVPRAIDYRIYMTLADGTRQVVNTRAHRATFGPIFVDIGGTITVQAVGDGLNTRTGASVRGRLAPVFGRGRPVGQPKRHKPRRR
jgi:hypothetical protein